MSKTNWWVFTNYNMEFDYKKYMEKTTATYVAYGLEHTKKGQPHHQGWVHFSGARGSKKNVGKQLGGCWCNMMEGTIDQNEDYCSKEGELIEFGIKPKPGRRTDLDALKDRIIEGKETVDDLAIENPHMYHLYGRTLSKLEDIALRKKYRCWMTEGIWYVGKTGTGKSHKAFEDFNPDTHYVFPNDGGWWDGYKGQDTVIINEFRGGIAYAELLDLMDKWPKTVKRRNREPVPFLAKQIIITSSQTPEQVYNYLAAEDSVEYDSLDQLRRRITLIRLDERYSLGNNELESNTTAD